MAAAFQWDIHIPYLHSVSLVPFFVPQTSDDVVCLKMATRKTLQERTLARRRRVEQEVAKYFTLPVSRARILKYVPQKKLNLALLTDPGAPTHPEATSSSRPGVPPAVVPPSPSPPEPPVSSPEQPARSPARTPGRDRVQISRGSPDVDHSPGLSPIRPRAESPGSWNSAEEIGNALSQDLLNEEDTPELRQPQHDGEALTLTPRGTGSGHSAAALTPGGRGSSSGEGPPRSHLPAAARWGSPAAARRSSAVLQPPPPVTEYKTPRLSPRKTLPRRHSAAQSIADQVPPAFAAVWPWITLSPVPRSSRKGMGNRQSVPLIPSATALKEHTTFFTFSELWGPGHVRRLEAVGLFSVGCWWRRALSPVWCVLGGGGAQQDGRMVLLHE